MIPRACAASVEALLAELAGEGVMTKTMGAASEMWSSFTSRITSTSSCQSVPPRLSQRLSAYSSLGLPEKPWAGPERAKALVPRRFFVPGRVVWLNRRTGDDKDGPQFTAVVPPCRAMFKDILLTLDMLSNHGINRYIDAAQGW